MIKKIVHILFLLFSISFLSFAQEFIKADITSGCDSLTVHFSLENALPADNYVSINWEFGDQNVAWGTLDVIHTYTEPGVYNVSCVLNGNKVITETGLIRIGATPFAEFSFRDVSEDDTKFEYRFEPEYFRPFEGIGISYKWIFPDGSEGIDSTVTFEFPADSIYPVTLIVTDVIGCSDTVSRLVPVSKQLVIPNVFTPNGDHVNDYFEVTTPGDYTYNFRIFTKAGLQVYFSRSPVISWDGRLVGGTEAPEGIYFYSIESDETPLETSVSGFVYLFR